MTKRSLRIWIIVLATAIIIPSNLVSKPNSNTDLIAQKGNNKNKDDDRKKREDADKKRKAD
ncbi:MAG: hypothetical protein ABUK01_17275, partial [Leptospirales bacterium]